MKKFLMLGAFLLCLAGATFAQEDTEEEEAYVGGGSMKFSGAILFGNSNFLNNNGMPGSPGTAYWSISGAAPYANVVSNSANITNMVGAEARMFINDQIAIRLNGGAILRNTPARDNVPAFIDPASPNVTWIPNYEAVTGDNSFDMNMILGAEYHLAVKGKLSPYVGVGVPFYYARKSQYNPNVTVSSTGNVVITDIATRHVETIGFGGQIIAGADYNFTDNFYIGLEIKPFSYVYSYNTKFPAPGLETLQADNHTRGYFTQPFFKMGFML